MTDFVYPVNDRDPDNWGDGIGVLDYFRSLRSGAVDTWYWGSAFRLVEVSDRIWVYAAAPHSRIIAAGVAQGDARWSEEISHWWVPVKWDLPVTKVLLRGEPPALSHAPQAPQRVGGDDLDALLVWLHEAEAPDLATIPDEVVERYRQVRQRQGQLEFRRKLIEAYGRCGVTGAMSKTSWRRRASRATTTATAPSPMGCCYEPTSTHCSTRACYGSTGTNGYGSPTEPGYKPYRSLDGTELRRPPRREDWPDKEKLRADREGARR